MISQATEQHLEPLCSVLNGDYSLKGDEAISRKTLQQEAFKLYMNQSLLKHSEFF